MDSNRWDERGLALAIYAKVAAGYVDSAGSANEIKDKTLRKIRRDSLKAAKVFFEEEGK